MIYAVYPIYGETKILCYTLVFLRKYVKKRKYFVLKGI